jgi:hypothetical protein
MYEYTLILFSLYFNFTGSCVYVFVFVVYEFILLISSSLLSFVISECVYSLAEIRLTLLIHHITNTLYTIFPKAFLL